MMRDVRPIVAAAAALLMLQSAGAGANGLLRPADAKAGYLARLLLNETPFPGERGWVSEADTKAAMLQILWVLHSRIAHVPKGYSQRELAATESRDLIDAITAGGVRGQCDGFYRDSNGRPAMVSRVPKRLDYLLKIANTGKPGKFARLMEYGQGLADAYFSGGIKEADRFAKLTSVQRTPVTGRAYSWMADKDCYKPGGNFVRIPNDSSGSLGGNRFFTLRRLKP